MSTRVFFLNSPTTQYGEEELNSIQKYLFDQGILNTIGTSWEDWIANGDLKIIQRGAGANMSVDVLSGWALLNTTRNAITFKVFCQSIGTNNLTITNNVSGSNRVDAVILRVSRSTTPNVTANNVVTRQVVVGSGITALTDGAITTAIGGDDFIRLANITVANGAVSILTANIADTRVRATTGNATFKQSPEMIEFKTLATDPSTLNLVKGFVWFNSTTNTLNFYDGSVVKALGGTSNFLSDDDTTIDGVDQQQTTQNATRPVGEADATTRNNQLAQSFIASKTSITGVRLFKSLDSGTFTGTVTVALFANSAGSPTGSALATVTISNVNWLALGIGEFTAIFGSPFTATLGTTYHIVISTSTADNTNRINLGTNSAGGYASGSVKFRNTTDGWVSVATIDLYFKTLQTTVNKVARTNSLGKIDTSILPVKSGGTGADGALNVISGTTSIDLASASFFTRNYTSINIASGATVNFINPASGGTLIQLKSQGAVNIQGTLDASGTGSAGGVAVTGTGLAGNVGTALSSSLLLVSAVGTGGGAGATGGGGAGATLIANANFYIPSVFNLNAGFGRYLLCGVGGGSGSTPSSGSGTSGAGGRGGAGLYIECGGAWNFTGTINTSGIVGGNASTNGGGGGGGGAGTFLALYNSLIANSGTVTNNSGAGGSGVGSFNCGGAGGGSSSLGSGGNGGFNAGAPASPTNGGGGGGGGGAGGITGGASSTSASLSLITLNNYFL